MHNYLNKEKVLHFLKDNYLYIIWFIVYFTIAVMLFGGTWQSFLFCVVLYAISLSIAFSRLGELIFRLINKVRILYTKREKEYLIPLFEGIYSKDKKISYFA
jgi:hypothetical protein